MTHVLVIGEALVDAVERPGQPTAEHPGGSPANVALGLGRLGRHVSLLTWIGTDERGRRVAEHLGSSRVELAPGSTGAERTSVARAVLDDDGVATYDFDLLTDLPEMPPLEGITAIHIGSISAVLEPGASRIDEALERARGAVLLSYDPNLRPSLMGEADGVRGRVEHLVAQSDVVKASDEDIAWLYPDVDPVEVIRRWAQTGPALVVLTRGGDGSTAVTSAGEEYSLPAPPVQVVDTVGAGDSFMSGLLNGLWSADLLHKGAHSEISELGPHALRTLLDGAAAVAAVTVSRAGANPPSHLELL